MTTWKASKHALFRGDAKGGVLPPVPSADASIVRHVLYLDGPGRLSPYLSTTESHKVAKHFARRQGLVYRTTVSSAKAVGVSHRSRKELLQLLKGRGKGDAAWHSPYEVAQARRYVEQWAEHLYDYRGLIGLDPVVLTEITSALFEED